MRHYLDDLKSDFRSWERDCDNEQDANTLYGIMSGRHPNVDSDELRDACYWWVGYDPEEEEKAEAHWNASLKATERSLEEMRHRRNETS